MGMIQVRMPEELQAIVAREIAEGRVADEAAFFIEAAPRFADDLALEDEIVAEAEAGIADIEAGRFVLVSSAEDLETLRLQSLARLHDHLAVTEG